MMTGKGALRSALLAAFLSAAGAVTAAAETKTYNIDITDQTMNVTGKPVEVMTVGGSVPGPLIEANEGDTLRVTFNNHMHMETSIHWHGVLLPNDQDGVPYINTPPIPPHGSFTYEFPVKQHGTYWYHAHSHMMEQRGVYGPLLFHPAEEKVSAHREAMIVLSDWTDEDPHSVLRNLKRDDDFYGMKKDSVQSWDKVIAHGWQAVKTRLKNSWNRMAPMDIADVGYDAFLANGQKMLMLHDAKPGEKVRLRLINAGGSTYFNVQFSGGPLTVVAADGIDTEPLRLEHLRMAMAETYDVIITMPEDGRSYELRATAEDGTGYSSAMLGMGEFVPAPDMPVPSPYATGGHNHHQMDHSHMDHGAMNHEGMDHSRMDQTQMDQTQMDHSHHNMPPVEPPPQVMKEYEFLRSAEPTAYDPARPTRDVLLELTGNMKGYTWSFDNKPLSQADKILVRKGEKVTFTLVNKTMMNHPLHLHGHFFRVLNGQGDNSPLKHTVNVPPFETVTIEFAADEEKDWLFHCHNLYHMTAGMTRVVSYEGSPDNPGLKTMRHDREWFHFPEVAAQNNMVFGEMRSTALKNAFDVEYDWNYRKNYDVHATYERSLTPHLQAFAGVNLERKPGQEAENRLIAGVHYTLPLLIDSELRVDNAGHFRLKLESELPLTRRLNFAWRANTDGEYRTMFEYELDKNTRRRAITGGYDSVHGWGAGMKIRF